MVMNVSLTINYNEYNIPMLYFIAKNLLHKIIVIPLCTYRQKQNFTKCQTLVLCFHVTDLFQ